jgi:hypothetical protein
MTLTPIDEPKRADESDNPWEGCEEITPDCCRCYARRPESRGGDER